MPGHGLAGVASPVPENKNNGEAGSVLGHGLPAATVAPPVPENQNNGEADPDAETVPAPHAPVVAALGSTMTPEIHPMVAKMWEPVQKEIDEKKRQAELELESTCQKRQKVEHEVGVWTAKLEQIQTKFALFERDLAKAQAQLQESSKMQTVLAEREHAIQAAEHELEKRQAKFEGEMDAWDSQRAVVLAEIDTKFDELRREEVQARQTQNAGPFADPKASLRAKIHQVDQVRPLLNSGSADVPTPTPSRTPSASPTSTPGTTSTGSVLEGKMDAASRGEVEVYKCHPNTRFTSSTHPEAWGALYRVVRKVDVDGNPVCPKDIYDAWHQGLAMEQPIAKSCVYIKQNICTVKIIYIYIYVVAELPDFLLLFSRWIK